MEKVWIEFFGMPGSRCAASARQKLVELVKELQVQGIKALVEEKSALEKRNRDRLKKYAAQLGVKLSPQVSAIVPLIAVNNKAAFIGFHPGMGQAIKRRMETGKVLQ